MSGLDALADLHARDRELGVDPFAISRAEASPPPLPPPAPALEIPPFDSSSVVEIPREPDPALVVEDTESAPARRRQKSRTPRLDQVKAEAAQWRGEQVRAS